MSEKKMSKRQQRREMRQKQEMRGRIITISVIVIGALLVAFALIYPNLRPSGEFVTPDENPRPQAEANGMGDSNAPVMVEEFSDFQCPYCQRWFQETESQLVSAYVETGKVYFVYRSFGAFIGPESEIAAEAAYCAGDQGKFWEMHDIIFENHPGGENVNYYTDRQLASFAEALDLDMNAFSDCYGSGKYKDQVQKDYVDGQAAGVTGTPAFVITYTVDGEQKQRFIAGAYPFSEFQTQIDGALAEMGLE